MNPPTKEDLQERAQLVRIHEANCGIEHPSVDELKFRWATMKRLAALYDYASVKGVELTVAAPAGKGGAR